MKDGLLHLFNLFGKLNVLFIVLNIDNTTEILHSEKSGLQPSAMHVLLMWDIDADVSVLLQGPWNWLDMFCSIGGYGLRLPVPT